MIHSNYALRLTSYVFTVNQCQSFQRRNRLSACILHQSAEYIKINVYLRWIHQYKVHVSSLCQKSAWSRGLNSYIAPPATSHTKSVKPSAQRKYTQFLPSGTLFGANTTITGGTFSITINQPSKTDVTCDMIKPKRKRIYVIDSDSDSE